MKRQIQSLASISGLRIQCHRELWCRLQTQLGSRVAVAVASSCSFDSTLSLGTFKCHRCSPKMLKRKKERKEGKKEGRKEERKKERKNPASVAWLAAEAWV